MLQIKSKVDYGLLIMIELAKNKKFAPLSQIAKKLNISSVYLIQISQSLIKADLITSKEGTGGGYKLTKKAKDISVLDIIEALENKINVRCLSSKGITCPNLGGCNVRNSWVDILDDLKKVLKKRTLASLVK